MSCKNQDSGEDQFPSDIGKPMLVRGTLTMLVKCLWHQPLDGETKHHILKLFRLLKMTDSEAAEWRRDSAEAYPPGLVSLRRLLQRAIPLAAYAQDHPRHEQAAQDWHEEANAAVTELLRRERDQTSGSGVGPARDGNAANDQPSEPPPTTSAPARGPEEAGIVCEHRWSSKVHGAQQCHGCNAILPLPESGHNASPARCGCGMLVQTELGLCLSCAVAKLKAMPDESSARSSSVDTWVVVRRSSNMYLGAYEWERNWKRAAHFITRGAAEVARQSNGYVTVEKSGQFTRKGDSE